MTHPSSSRFLLQIHCGAMVFLFKAFREVSGLVVVGIGH
jgi:hypothetical protein